MYNVTNTKHWQVVTDSVELCVLLLECNVDYLCQVTADVTPFATHPTQQIFGLYATEDADKVL